MTLPEAVARGMSLVPTIKVPPDSRTTGVPEMIADPPTVIVFPPITKDDGLGVKV